MSESVVGNSGANALWQVHRFSSAVLKALEGWAGVGGGGCVCRAVGGGVGGDSLLRSAEGGYLKEGWRRAAKPIRWGKRSWQGGRWSEDAGLERRLVADNSI